MSSLVIFNKKQGTALIFSTTNDERNWCLPISNIAEAQNEFELLVMHRGNINAYFDLTKYQATETPATK